MNRSSIIFITFIVIMFISSIFFTIWNKSDYLKRIIDPSSFKIKESNYQINVKSNELENFLTNLDTPKDLLIIKNVDISAIFDLHVDSLKKKYPYIKVIKTQMPKLISYFRHYNNINKGQVILSHDPIEYYGAKLSSIMNPNLHPPILKKPI